MSLNRNGFQTFVQRDPAPAVLGDFASMNPRATALAGAGAFRSASTLNYLSAQNNAVVGNFAWGQGAYAYGQKPTGASVAGFVANELQTIIPFLAPGAGVNPVRLAVQDGFPVTLYTHGDFWVLPTNMLSGAVAAGDTAYTRPADGSVTNDPTAFAATGVGAGANVTISAVTTGALVPGMILAGVGVDAGLTVVSQTSGTPGGAGVYVTSTATGFASTAVTSAAVDTGYKFQSSTTADAVTTASATIAANTGVLTIGAMASGVVEVGQNVSGTGVPSNLFIQAQLTGTAGGAGTYQLNTIGPAVANFTATLSQGKLAKISRTF